MEKIEAAEKDGLQDNVRALEAAMPEPKTTGRPRTTSLRDVFDAILYMATTGCQWRMLRAVP